MQHRGTKRHHDSGPGMSHDSRDAKRRKMNRGPDPPYSPQSAGGNPGKHNGPPYGGGPPHGAYGANPAPPYGGQGPPYGQPGGSPRYAHPPPPPPMSGGPPPHGPPPPHSSYNAPPMMGRGPPPGPPSRMGHPYGSSNQPPSRAYGHGPPPPSHPHPHGQMSPAGGYGPGQSLHSPSMGGDHNTPMSPSGGKRKPSIFHTPAQKGHGPSHSHSHGIMSSDSKQISPSSQQQKQQQQKKNSLQSRRELQLNKISTRPAVHQQPEYGPRKPTKDELLHAIEKYDVDIAKLSKELSTSRQSTVSDPTAIDDEKYFQDPEIKRKPLMHQMFFSNFVKSIEAHSKFDIVKYFPRQERDPEFPLKDESFWHHLYQKEREAYSTIADQMNEAIKKNVDRDRKWLRNMKKRFATAQRKWLKANDVKPPPKDWLSLAAIPPPMKTQEQREFVFIDDNGFVDDPLLVDNDYYSKCAELSRWNDYEVEIFQQKYHIYPKNFRKISEFLPNKTVGDCVNFYYHNKKDPILKPVIDEVKAKGSFQAAWSEGGQANAGGKPSILNADGTHADTGRPPSEDEMEDSGDEQYVFKPSNSRGRPKRKKGKDADSDSWTDSERAQFVEAFEAHPKDWKRIAAALHKSVAQCKSFFSQNKHELGLSKSRGRQRGRRSTRASKEEKASSGKGARGAGGKRKKSSRKVNYWTKSEKTEFLQYLQKFGKDWKAIASALENKTENQVLKHYQSIKKSLGLPQVDEDDLEGTKKKSKKRAREKTAAQIPREPPLPPDNDLRLFAEIAAIKGSIELNSTASLEDEKEDQTYSTTTKLHSWIVKKYMSGVIPTNQRPSALDLLAHESEKQHRKVHPEEADDVKDLLSQSQENEDAMDVTPTTVSYLHNELAELGYFWGDEGLLDGTGNPNSDYVPVNTSGAKTSSTIPPPPQSTVVLKQANGGSAAAANGTASKTVPVPANSNTTTSAAAPAPVQQSEQQQQKESVATNISSSNATTVPSISVTPSAQPAAVASSAQQNNQSSS